jgi:hypothetical protein
MKRRSSSPQGKGWKESAGLVQTLVEVEGKEEEKKERREGGKRETV